MEVDWERLTPEERKIALYNKQKAILDAFLERNADEIEEEKLRKELGELNERKKKEKKKFPENDKKRLRN